MHPSRTAESLVGLLRLLSDRLRREGCGRGAEQSDGRRQDVRHPTPSPVEDSRGSSGSRIHADVAVSIAYLVVRPRG